MSHIRRPQTPPNTNAPYPIGSICRLLRASWVLLNSDGIRKEVHHGEEVKIVRAEPILLTGAAGPLTAETAGYKISAELKHVIWVAGPTIGSKRVAHKMLAPNPKEACKQDLYAKGAQVYLLKAFTYRSRGTEYTVPADTRVTIVEDGMTETGVNSKPPWHIAFYKIAVSEPRLVPDTFSNTGRDLIRHNELQFVRSG